MKNNDVMNGMGYVVKKYLVEYADFSSEPCKANGIFDEAREFLSDFQRSTHEKTSARAE